MERAAQLAQGLDEAEALSSSDRAELSRVWQLRKLNQPGSVAQAMKEQVDVLDAQLEEMTLKRAKNEL